MSEESKKRREPSATPWDDLPDEKLEPSQLLVARSHRSMYEFRHEPFDGDIGFLNSYARGSCPLCGSEEVVKAGLSKAGVQRYACRGCGHRFTPVLRHRYQAHF